MVIYNDELKNVVLSKIALNAPRIDNFLFKGKKTNKVKLYYQCMPYQTCKIVVAISD